MTRTQKCQPLKCSWFKQRFDATVKNLANIPVDVYVVQCPHRTTDNYCRNRKEKLDTVLIK